MLGGDMALGRSKSFRFDPWSKESGILVQRETRTGQKRQKIQKMDHTVATSGLDLSNILELGPQNNSVFDIQHSLAYVN